jgi:hypothetical protein
MSRILFFLAIVSTAGFPQITFHRDVEPILQKRCQSCHRPGQIAPMSFLSFDQVRPWAKAIREAVLLRRMPPWHAEPGHLAFRNDLSMSEPEIRTIAGWVDQGVKQGDPREAPSSAANLEGWRIETPDAVFQMPEAFQVPARGEIGYQYYAVQTGFTEDHWVEMAEVRPENHAVVHHAIVSTRSDFGAEYLAGYAPGMSPQIWTKGMARLVPAGAVLIFQVHYTANGKPASDRTRIGLRFARSVPEKRVMAMRAADSRFAIPAGASDHPVTAGAMIDRDSELVGMRPHMHLRGKSFEFRAVFQDGREQILLRVPRYDFNWQPYYYLAQPVPLPAGTRIECRATFDNSANNPRNPDPSRVVGWGEQSWEEMMIGWFDVAVAVAAGKN